MGKGIKPQQREPESLEDFHKFQDKSDLQTSVKGYYQTVIPSTKEDNHSLKHLSSKTTVLTTSTSSLINSGS